MLKLVEYLRDKMNERLVLSVRVFKELHEVTYDSIR